MDGNEIDSEKLLKRIKRLLEEAHGDRLKGIVLYGSEARGEAEDESDIDILVLLEGPISLWDDIRKNIEAIYDLQLEIPRPIHASPVNMNDFEAGEYALYRRAKEEGIFA